MYMNTDIDIFIDKMTTTLNYDLTQFIISMIYKEYNAKIILKQKKLKIQLNKNILSVFNTYYHDNSIMIYRNSQNQMVLKNFKANQNNQLYLCNQEQQNEIVQSDSNDTVLFNCPPEEMPQRNIKLYIVYI